MKVTNLTNCRLLGVLEMQNMQTVFSVVHACHHQYAPQTRVNEEHPNCNKQRSDLLPSVVSADSVQVHRLRAHATRRPRYCLTRLAMNVYPSQQAVALPDSVFQEALNNNHNEKGWS